MILKIKRKRDIMTWKRLTETELKDLAEDDEQLLKILREGDDVWSNVKDMASEGDVDELLDACRKFINFHINDVDKYMKEGN